jgi:hypothetical protein
MIFCLFVSEGTEFTVQLMTYHGKVILEDQISAPAGKVSRDVSLFKELKVYLHNPTDCVCTTSESVVQHNINR